MILQQTIRLQGKKQREGALIARRTLTYTPGRCTYSYLLFATEILYLLPPKNPSHTIRRSVWEFLAGVNKITTFSKKKKNGCGPPVSQCTVPDLNMSKQFRLPRQQTAVLCP